MLLKKRCGSSPPRDLRSFFDGRVTHTQTHGHTRTNQRSGTHARTFARTHTLSLALAHTCVHMCVREKRTHPKIVRIVARDPAPTHTHTQQRRREEKKTDTGAACTYERMGFLSIYARVRACVRAICACTRGRARVCECKGEGQSARGPEKHRYAAAHTLFFCARVR